jgi:membrane fusion protein, multidrug efflux system
MPRHALIITMQVTLLAVLLSACNREPKAVATQESSGTSTKNSKSVRGAAESAASLLLAAEDLFTVGADASSSGPSITGAIQPERRADMRAEVSAVVLQVIRDNGDKVNKGDLLIRLDDTAIRDSLNSAEASARSSQQAFDQAQRQYERLVKLRETGMVSTQAVEDAEIRRNNSQSDMENARARLVSARQQLNRTEIRAPFDGIASDRKVSAGDTVQIGKELIKVIDPSSMRFEGMVSADYVDHVKPNQVVHFRIHGYSEKEFAGKVARVNPATNITTRQIEVRVNFDEGNGQPILAGLYAEGHIETEMKAHVKIPASAIVADGENKFAWKVTDSGLQKTKLDVGTRDERTGEFELRGGVEQGDVLLRHPTNKLIDGQKVEMSDKKTTPSAA